MEMVKEIMRLEKKRKENLINSLDNITEATNIEEQRFYNELGSKYPKFVQTMVGISNDNKFLRLFMDFKLSINNIKILNPIYDKEEMNHTQLDISEIRKFVSSLYDVSLENIEIYFFEEKFINSFREAFTIPCGKDNHVIFLAKKHPDLDNTLAHEFGHNVCNIISRENNDINKYYTHHFVSELVAYFTQLKFIEKYGDKRDCLRLLHTLVQLNFALLILFYPSNNFEEFYRLDVLSNFKDLYKKHELKKYYNIFKENDYFYEYCYKFSSLILAIDLIDDLETIFKVINYDRTKSISDLLKDLNFDISNINEKINDLITKF